MPSPSLLAIPFFSKWWNKFRNYMIQNVIIALVLFSSQNVQVNLRNRKKRMRNWLLSHLKGENNFFFLEASHPSHTHTHAGLRASSSRKVNRFKTLTFKSVSQNGGKCLKTPVQSTLLAPPGPTWTDWLMTPGTVSMLSSVPDTAPSHTSLLNIFKLTTINWRAEYLSILVRL